MYKKIRYLAVYEISIMIDCERIVKMQKNPMMFVVLNSESYNSDIRICGVLFEKSYKLEIRIGKITKRKRQNFYALGAFPNLLFYRPIHPLNQRPFCHIMYPEVLVFLVDMNSFTESARQYTFF